MQTLLTDWRKYRKALVGVLGAVLTVLNVVYVNDPRIQTAIAVATALGIYQVPNAK